MNCAMQKLEFVIKHILQVLVWLLYTADRVTVDIFITVVYVQKFCHTFYTLQLWICVLFSVFHEVAKISPLREQEMDLLRSCKASGRTVVRYNPAWFYPVRTVIFVIFLYELWHKYWAVVCVLVLSDSHKNVNLHIWNPILWFDSLCHPMCVCILYSRQCTVVIRHIKFSNTV